MLWLWFLGSFGRKTVILGLLRLFCHNEWCSCLCAYVPQCCGVADIMKAADMDTPLAVKFLTAGTAACVADAASFPLDTAKVRLQVSWCVGTCMCVCVCVCVCRSEKPSMCSCFVNRMQDNMITQRWLIKPIKMWKSSNIWERHYQIKIVCTKKLRAV